jgi:hypothetical protein
VAFSGNGAIQGASAGSAAGPWGAAIGAVAGGLFGGGEPDAPSSATSGVGFFGVKNKFNPEYSPPIIDFENPVHILVAGLLVVGGFYAWKRFK